VQLRLANPRQKGNFLIKPGMLARVSLPVGEAHIVTLVPKDALVLGGPKPTVFVVSNGVARMIPVETGVSIDSLIEVTGDVKAGDKVVVTGNERLRPGPVKVLKEIPIPQEVSAE
jgi:multidrug efflux pump subunit AcrA (membrane-fusion protein)